MELNPKTLIFVLYIKFSVLIRGGGPLKRKWRILRSDEEHICMEKSRVNFEVGKEGVWLGIRHLSLLNLQMELRYVMEREAFCNQVISSKYEEDSGHMK